MLIPLGAKGSHSLLSLWLKVVKPDAGEPSSSKPMLQPTRQASGSWLGQGDMLVQAVQCGGHAWQPLSGRRERSLHQPCPAGHQSSRETTREPSPGRAHPRSYGLPGWSGLVDAGAGAMPPRVGMRTGSSGNVPAVMGKSNVLPRNSQNTAL